MPGMELVVIGGGNMGEALLKGVVRAKVLPPAAVMLAEPVERRRDLLSRELGIAAAAEVAAAAGAERFVLAVKPQQMEAACRNLRAALPDSALVISIAAGISTAYLANALGKSARIIRAMPNTPILVGAGCTAIAAGPGATEQDLNFAQRLFAAGGATQLVDEAAMDAVTAVSGSGPAYFFYLIEAMMEAGIAEGLPGEGALKLACQTCAARRRS